MNLIVYLMVGLALSIASVSVVVYRRRRWLDANQRNQTRLNSMY